VPAAGRQRREGAKNEREKDHLVAEVLKTFHLFGEFSFVEISQTNFAALRLCVKLNRVLGLRPGIASPRAHDYLATTQ
jgi:hypothetical protein